MEGVLHTFNNPDDASPSSSPMPVDARDLPAGVDPMDTGLFAAGNVDSTSHVQSSSRSCSSYRDSPTTGLGLFVQEPVLCVDPQDLLLVRDADTRPATPATRRSLREQGVQALRRAALGLTPSFVALACNLGNSQPANVGFQAPRHADARAAGGASDGADTGLTEQDPGVETEVEEDVAPSPAAPLPVDPLPLSEDLTPCVQGKRGTKRTAGGSAKRASKRQRSSKSSAPDPLVEPEPESDADAQPATSSTGRPTRKVTQRAPRPARQESPPSGNEAAEGSSSCTKCWKTFGRTYDLDRHLRQSACANADKLVCRVCGSALSPRSDAQRRHLMTTDKCVAKQLKMDPELLAVLGCPTPEERAEYLQDQAARKTASKKSKKCK